MTNVKHDSWFRLRVPLCVLVEYKGVVGLVVDVDGGVGSVNGHSNNDNGSINNTNSSKSISLSRELRHKYKQ